MPGQLSRLKHGLERLKEKLWFRTAVIATLALVAAGAASVVGPLVPKKVADFVGPEAVNDLIHIIASSMLSVTIFSLSVMVTVHRAVSGQWSPRAHRLVVSDRTTMNALATFVGAWLFALMAIIMRDAAFIGEEGEVVVLFVMTLVVIGLIVVTVVRWIAHLQQLGSLAQMGGRLEWEARRALDRRLDEPCLGGRPFTGGRDAIPPAAAEIRAETTGWVQHVDADALDRLAARHGAQIYLWAPIGRFVHSGDPLAFTDDHHAELAEGVRAAVTVGQMRRYDQDPRFGLVVLGEVASKALSPGINDAGTAIEVIARITRALESWREDDPARIPRRPNLHVPPLRASDLLEDAFAPIARDGADMVEVQIHLQHALHMLERHGGPSMAGAAREVAADAWTRAESALDASDLERLRRSLPRTTQRVAAE